MRDARSVRAAMAGIRHVFHVAADYRLWARDPREIYAANVDGTRIVMQEAKSACVERIVYTSSVATIALRDDGEPADESIGLSVGEGIGTYKRSKIAAERLVEAMVANENLPAVIVNPSTPIGPRDVKPTPTGRIIVEAARGRMPGFLDTGLNLVHVDDVAEGHFAALGTARSANATFSAAKTCCSPTCWPTSRVSWAGGRRRGAFRARRHSVAYVCRDDRAADRAAPIHHAGRHTHGRSSYVFHRGQSRTRTRLHAAALPRGRSAGSNAILERSGSAKACRESHGVSWTGFPKMTRRAKVAVIQFNKSGCAVNPMRQAAHVSVALIAADGIARSPRGSDAIGIAQARRIPRHNDSRAPRRQKYFASPGADRFRPCPGGQSAQQSGDALFGHCARPRQSEHRIGSHQSGRRARDGAATRPTAPRRGRRRACVSGSIPAIVAPRLDRHAQARMP